MTASNLGYWSSTSVTSESNSSSRACGLAGLLGRVQESLGINIGNVLDAHVGLDAGRGPGVFGGNVSWIRPC